jgi:hypothetical protein
VRTQIDTLNKENFQLKIDRAAKEQVIGQMIDERRAWLVQITEQSREIGRLEMQVQQLAAPSRDVARHDATDVVTDATTAAEPESVTGVTEAPPAATTTPAAADAAKPSLWRRMFH